jgi:hypothetical protein
VGSDLSMSPPQKPIWRLVRGEGYMALYRREVDEIYLAESTDSWRRIYLCDDPDELASNAMQVVLGIFATGRYLTLNRDDLCRPSAAEPFAESYPKNVLETDDPLQNRRYELLRQLAEVERQIKEQETK